MKKMMMALAVAVILPSCTKNDEPETMPTLEISLPSDSIATHATVTFAFGGDVEIRPMTRASLTELNLTDVWVFDYMGGELKQQVHQSSEDEDFGVPQMDLAYGSHHVYFVVSRGLTPTLDTDAKTIVWTKPLDTFWVDYLCDVVATSNGNRSVTLDRVVTKLKLTFTDAIHSGAATINITPHTWYYGLNYATGEPCAAATDQVFTISIPSTEIGKTGVFTNMYGFSTTTEWTTDIAANSKTSANQVLGSCTIEDAPFKANRVTEYSGPLFNAGGVMTLSLNTDWDEQYNGTW